MLIFVLNTRNLLRKNNSRQNKIKTQKKNKKYKIKKNKMRRIISKENCSLGAVHKDNQFVPLSNEETLQCMIQGFKDVSLWLHPNIMNEAKRIGGLDVDEKNMIINRTTDLARLKANLLRSEVHKKDMIIPQLEEIQNKIDTYHNKIKEYENEISRLSSERDQLRFNTYPNDYLIGFLLGYSNQSIYDYYTENIHSFLSRKMMSEMTKEQIQNYIHNKILTDMKNAKLSISKNKNLFNFTNIEYLISLIDQSMRQFNSYI